MSSYVFLLFARAAVAWAKRLTLPQRNPDFRSFPQERRARAQAIFATGMLLGGAAGQALGGIVGPPLWVAVRALHRRGNRRDSRPRRSLAERTGTRSALRSRVALRLLGVPAFVAMLAGGTCITFSSVSLLFWGVDFAVTYKDFSLRQASVSLSLIVLVSSVCGVLFGGYVADFLQKRFSYGRLIATAAAFLLAAPFLILAIQTEEQMDRSRWIGDGWILHGLVPRAGHRGIHDMMPRRAHGTSVGLYMFVTQLLGGWVHTCSAECPIFTTCNTAWRSRWR